MFFVFNKRKINSYLISMGTVIMLLLVSMFVNNGIESNGIENAVPTSATNIVNSQSNENKTQTKNATNGINYIENAENNTK